MSDLKDSKKFPVLYSNRGGKFTYHGPGQRVIYLMIKLERFNFDVRKYVSFLEELTIKTLDDFNISSHRSKKGIGVWTFGKEKFGNGSLVYLVDNMLFRGFWYSGKQVFSNAVFF